ncbi:hypothetical protein UFOVP1463_6 [uncultured Caudovirales phage]|uniref:Uncharacterized protein n=1 Tax=uncultured Caudovirales phage TaxID=2100421 RepID=A0A6J5QJE7_9CAUD|nr:hypothetical protein UFOVP1102_15 [uncultured Caudovirales phage]CAB4213850.1 hypothetical protein UFOVP1463_6 [uncultured Caudovirales phage]
MATQQNPVDYAKAIQAQLVSIVTPVPVYAAFNRNFATQPKFITWMLRNVHQPVYTGIYQAVKGIDTPVFQISIFTQAIEEGFTISNQILQALHGYSGLFGGATYGFQISKADVMWLYNSYDNEEKLAQVFLDCTIYVPT